MPHLDEGLENVDWCVVDCTTCGFWLTGGNTWLIWFTWWLEVEFRVCDGIEGSELATIKGANVNPLDENGDCGFSGTSWMWLFVDDGVDGLNGDNGFELKSNTLLTLDDCCDCSIGREMWLGGAIDIGCEIGPCEFMLLKTMPWLFAKPPSYVGVYASIIGWLIVVVARVVVIGVWFRFERGQQIWKTYQYTIKRKSKQIQDKLWKI